MYTMCLGVDCTQCFRQHVVVRGLLAVVQKDIRDRTSIDIIYLRRPYTAVPSFPIHPDLLNCSVAACSTVRMRASAGVQNAKSSASSCVTLPPKGNLIL